MLADLDCLEDCFERPRVANRLCVASKLGFDADELRSQLITVGCSTPTLSFAKTSSDSLRSTEMRQSVHRSKTPSLVGGRASGIVRPSALHGHTGVAMEDGERAGWAAELDL